MVDIAKATNRKIEITEPTDEDTGRVSIQDDNGCKVVYIFYPNDAGVETLTLLCYSNDLMEASVSNSYHEGELKYSTYMQTREPKKIEVDSEEELRQFVFAESVEEMDEYKESVSENEEFEVTLDIETIQEENGVSFEIKTNLPNRTQLMLTFSGEDYIGQMKVEVKDGIVISDKFSKSGKAFSRGDYNLNVSMSLPVLQSEEVRKVIGENGEFMTGKYVKEDEYSSDKRVDGEFEVKILRDIFLKQLDFHKITI